MRMKRIQPNTLHRILYAFDFNRAQMDKLLHVLKSNWSIQLDHRFYEPYFLACMMDAIKLEELNTELVNDAFDPAKSHQFIQMIKEKMKEVLNMCAQKFDCALSTSVFSKWAYLLAYYGNYNGVRATIALALEEVENRTLEVHDEALCWYWTALIVALIKTNKLDEAIAVVDEMTTTGSKPNIHLYSRLIKACNEIPDVQSRIRRVTGLYRAAIDSGITPTECLLKDMITLFEGCPQEQSSLIEEAKKYNIII